ncbi:MAG: peptidoglycan-binding domain-containing protein [Paracoccaceae bacterium]
MAPATRSLAQVGDILGNVFRGEVTKTLENEAAKLLRQNAAPNSSVFSQREENRLIQTALNYFGFPAGEADGILGKRSRAAIAQYQESIGYAATGKLTSDQKSRLLASYRQATTGDVAALPAILGDVLRGDGTTSSTGSLGRLETRRTPADGSILPGGSIAQDGSVLVVPTTQSQDLKRTRAGDAQIGSGGALIADPNRLVSPQTTPSTNGTVLRGGSVARRTTRAQSSTTDTTGQTVLRSGGSIARDGSVVVVPTASTQDVRTTRTGASSLSTAVTRTGSGDSAATAPDQVISPQTTPSTTSAIDARNARILQACTLQGIPPDQCQVIPSGN